MTPRQVIELWLDAFNQADVNALANMYSNDAINHQVNTEPMVGREAIRQMFATEFSKADMVCIPENIFEDRDWAILEWRDPKGLGGCGFFQIKNSQIVFQRGYWDKLTFHRLYDIPLEI